MQRRRARRGFTLLEVFVVIGIIAMLIGLLLPAVQKVRESASRLQCQNNLLQIGLALNAHHSSHKHFPAGYVSTVAKDDTDKGPGWGWASHLLPFLEQGSVARQIRFDLDIADPANTPAREHVLQVFLCPSDGGFGSTPLSVQDEAGNPLCDVAFANYVGMFGFSEPGRVPGKGEGLFLRNHRIRRDEITDGTSTTMAVAERSSNISKPTWTGAVTGGVVRPAERFIADPGDPADPPVRHERATVLVLGHTGTVAEAHVPNNSSGHMADIHSQHVEGANVLFADGSVRLIRSTIQPAVWVALGTRAHGEAINAEDF
ncbi:MAG: DUF1559 domain-containing protein [Gemmataceae bacterium]|nr:DUF1559 domain-containing protein [Gemmataceae bacterium]